LPEPSRGKKRKSDAQGTDAVNIVVTAEEEEEEEEEEEVARPNTVFEKGQAVQVLWYEGTEEEAWIDGTIVKSKVAKPLAASCWYH
jgi:hypothetical protein